VETEFSDTIQKKFSPNAALLWQNLTATNERQITVHRYRPSHVPYGFDLAQYERSNLQQLIDDGYADAMRHDCEENNCVMPR
jgi:hypothetical protein